MYAENKVLTSLFLNSSRTEHTRTYYNDISINNHGGSNNRFRIEYYAQLQGY